MHSGLSLFAILAKTGKLGNKYNICLLTGFAAN